MKVSELVAKLQTLPQDGTVVHSDPDEGGDHREVVDASLEDDDVVFLHLSKE